MDILERIENDEARDAGRERGWRLHLHRGRGGICLFALVDATGSVLERAVTVKADPNPDYLDQIAGELSQLALADERAAWLEQLARIRDHVEGLTPYRFEEEA